MLSRFTELASIDGGGWVWFRLHGRGIWFQDDTIGERFQDMIYGLKC